MKGLIAGVIGGLMLTSSAAAADNGLVAALRHGMSSVLKDPASAQIEVTREPRRGTFKTKSATADGLIVCARLNAKNSYGGYVGFEDYVLVLQADHLVKAFPRLDRYLENADAWRLECYVPRPVPETDGKTSL